MRLPRPASERAPILDIVTMRLEIETMDAVLVEFDGSGRIRLEHEDWRTPTLQERRAIIHAAQNALADLTELLDALEPRTEQ